MPKLPDNDDQGMLILPLAQATVRLLAEHCEKHWNMTSEEFLHRMVHEFLFGSGPGRIESKEPLPTGHPKFSSLDLDKQQRLLLILLSFAESVPFEIAIKAAVRGEITYLWANELFLRMAGVSQLSDIVDKTTEEVWGHDPKRAKQIHALDEKVISLKRTLTHVDVVSHADTERARVGIRFLVGPREGHVLVLGSIGLDFKCKESAEAAQAALGTDGEFYPVPKKKMRPKRT